MNQNASQLRPDQIGWDTALYQGQHSFVWKLGEDLIDLLGPRACERVLDLGCGTGQLSGAIAERGAHVVGIDRSSEMVEQARRNFPALRFEVADVTDFALDAPVDAVFSNAVLHWVRPPERAMECVWRALRPGGRFVAEFGGKGNVAAIVDGIRDEFARRRFTFDNPWYFPSVGEYAGLLEREGFEVSFATLFDRPTQLQGDEGIRNWLRMFGAPLLAAVPPDEREAFVAAVCERVRPALYRDGKWFADYRRIRVVAYRPGGAESAGGA